eukprot:gene38019-46919_t
MRSQATDTSAPGVSGRRFGCWLSTMGRSCRKMVSWNARSSSSLEAKSFSARVIQTREAVSADGIGNLPSGARELGQDRSERANYPIGVFDVRARRRILARLRLPGTALHGAHACSVQRVVELLDAVAGDGGALLLTQNAFVDEGEVRAAVEHAARLLEQAGARVTLMQPFMTQTMLDGMDHFWRMRSHMDLQALPDAQRAKVLPYIRAWAESAAGFTGTQVFQASQQFHATRVATVRACSAFDYVLSPVAPMPAFATELPSPTNDPLRPLERDGQFTLLDQNQVIKPHPQF